MDAQVQRQEPLKLKLKKDLIRKVQDFVESRWDEIQENIQRLCSQRYVVNIYSTPSAAKEAANLLVVSAGKMNVGLQEEAVLSEFLSDVEERVSRRLGCTLNLELTGETHRDPITQESICVYEVFVST